MASTKLGFDKGRQLGPFRERATPADPRIRAAVIRSVPFGQSDGRPRGCGARRWSAGFRHVGARDIDELVGLMRKVADAENDAPPVRRKSKQLTRPSA